MPPIRTDDYLKRLVGELRKLSAESEWVEFKENNADPDEIGQYISALANSATLAEKSFAYIVWGVRDGDHQISGTRFKPNNKKVGDENLENWLLRNTRPQVGFKFHEVEIDSRKLVILEIESATVTPVRFRDDEWIRVGSHKKKLRDHHGHAKRLWHALESSTFEQGMALTGARDDEVVRLLDYPEYFDLLGTPLPENRSGILEGLEADNLIRRAPDGTWDVTNLGAILFARRLADFPSVARKSLRVVHYRGSSRVETIREQEGVRGYAAGFKGMIEYITNLLPASEVVGQALRQNLPIYPTLAIRELVANALIHQNLTLTGTI
jgi:ATP-dependent DNA helicase RecG